VVFDKRAAGPLIVLARTQLSCERKSGAGRLPQRSCFAEVLSMASPESTASPLHKQPYRVLALETRPQSLNELVGQETVRKVLNEVITSGRLPHALLFTGTRGTGKTSTARIFAKALCCVHGPTTTPCQVCPQCETITTSSNEDVLEIDGASNTGIDQIRELRESARFYPKSAAFKIFIIDEVHMLSTGAFNALLKTLEEPPPRVIFVLATTEVNKVPLTVRSRCMILSFRKVDTTTLAEHLRGVLQKRSIAADEDALKIVAREGRGSFRDALSLLEQTIPFITNHHLDHQAVTSALGLQDKDFARQIFLAICRQDPLAALDVLQEADQCGLDLGRLLQDSSQYFRHALVLKTCQTKGTAETGLLDDLLDSERTDIETGSSSLSPLALTECFRSLQEGVGGATRSSNQKPWAEIAVLEALERTHWMSTENLLRTMTGQDHSNDSAQTARSAPESKELRPPFIRQEVAGAPVRTQGRQGINPSASSTKHNPTPPAPAAGHPLDGGTWDRHARDGVDLPKLREWIHHVTEQSMPLGTKLRHAHFDRFNSEQVALAQTPENQIYGSISEHDRRLLLECLQKIGFAQARLQGFSGGGAQGAAEAKKKAIRTSLTPTL
jgi:DNA polymerase-3 subunit gamma/tau